MSPIITSFSCMYISAQHIKSCVVASTISIFTKNANVIGLMLLCQAFYLLELKHKILIIEKHEKFSILL